MEPAFLSSPPSFGARLAGIFFQAQCLGCGGRVESPALGGLCRPCWKGLPWILGPSQGVQAVARFEGSWRLAIHAYKFDGRLSFRRPFAALLHSQLGRGGWRLDAAVLGSATPAKAPCGAAVSTMWKLLPGPWL